jgi:hypothetical protein
MTTITLSSFLRALRYESVRMRTAASVRGLSALALLGAALATLPAVRALSGQSGGLGKAGFADVAWVVEGGRLGTVLPGAIAAAAAAWIGASSIDYEYRHGTAVNLFASIPRRGAVLAAKFVLVAALGALLELGCAALAFGAASLAFVMAGFPRPLLPAAALAPPAAIAFAAGCAVLSLLLATVVRIRLLATFVAVALVTIVAACVAGSGAAPSVELVRTSDTVNPLGAPVGRVADQFSALVHLPDDWKSASFLGVALVGVLALLLAGAARGAIGRRRAQ